MHKCEHLYRDKILEAINIYRNWNETRNARNESGDVGKFNANILDQLHFKSRITENMQLNSAMVTIKIKEL